MTRFEAWALGYPDKLCVRPGETVRFHVSGAGAETVKRPVGQADPWRHPIRRPGLSRGRGALRRGWQLSAARSADPPRLLRAHPGGRLDPRRHGADRRQPVRHGAPFADTGVQPLFSAWDTATETGMALVLEPGLRPAFWTTAARVALSEPLLDGVWYAVCGSWDPARGVLAVRALPVVNSYNSRFGPVTQVTPGAAELRGYGHRRCPTSTCCSAPSTPPMRGSCAAPTTASWPSPASTAARWATASWRRWRAAGRGPRSPIACARGGT